MKWQGKTKLRGAYDPARRGQSISYDATVELDIDLPALLRKLGGKAMTNKSRRSAMLHGLIKARIVYVAETGE